MRGLVLGLALAAAAQPAAGGEVFAARTLRAGTVLEAADLTPGQGPEGEVLLDALVGQETRRAIYADRPVTAADVGPPTLVHRNAVVVMVYSNGPLGIRAEGRALESGGAGARVRVLNLASRKAVVGTVSGPGQVEVAR